MCSREFAQRNLVMESIHVQQGVCTEKHSHENSHVQQKFAQRNLVMESTHVQQGLYKEKPSHGKYPCAAETLHRET